jgi:hypothetical protein
MLVKAVTTSIMLSLANSGDLPPGACALPPGAPQLSTRIEPLKLLIVPIVDKGLIVELSVCCPDGSFAMISYSKVEAMYCWKNNCLKDLKTLALNVCQTKEYNEPKPR